jgi:hypothetical protein
VPRDIVDAPVRYRLGATVDASAERHHEIFSIDNSWYGVGRGHAPHGRRVQQ